MQNLALISILAVMVYAVSLDLRAEDFRYVLSNPKAVIAGLLAQFLLLPWATLGATLLLDLPPPVEAAMILVAACPGGALSNIITHFGRGNLALSLSISAVSNVMALALTPFNFGLLIGLNPVTASWAKQIALNSSELMASLFLLLALPMGAALLTSHYLPAFKSKIRQPLENAALAALILFVLLALGTQSKQVWAISGKTLPLVMAHNALGLALGFLTSFALRLAIQDRRAVVIESGMQNAGLALGIIGVQFAADPFMVAVAGQWGIWHAVSGGALAYFWRRSDAQVRTSAR
jgi:bile acid:Na+ symporter, BASS family